MGLTSLLPLSLGASLYADMGLAGLSHKGAYALAYAKQYIKGVQFLPNIGWLMPADSLQITATNLLNPLVFFRELDVALLGAELLMVAIALGLAPALRRLLRMGRVFYDDLVSFCAYNNLSLTELATFIGVSGGFIVFDLFASISEEDLADTLSYGLLILVILLFFFLLLAVDIQYFYMVSSVSSGDLTTRTVVSDLVNNFLCALRIFFC